MAATSADCYAFAKFKLYPSQRTLLCGTSPVAIGGRAFDLLRLLVAQAGLIVSLNELMNFVWPNIAVEEANLRVQMALLRKVLAQCEEARRAIETIPLRGYCFVLPVQHLPIRNSQRNPSLKPFAPLPKPLTPVIGRDDAITAISAALEARRLVTITGPGGIGKTTVALATGKGCEASFKGHIVLVDLSNAKDGEAAMHIIAQVLGVEPQGNPLAALCEYLQSGEFLLILDTCEHIVEPIAALAEFLLSHCGGLRLLVTSREALRAVGEWTHRLASLSFPQEGELIGEADLANFSAVNLFIERIRSSVSFEVQSSDLPILGEICRRLDGIPLALEFAAARVPDLGLSKVAAHLDDRLAILTRGHRTALPRHRTLSAALDWSFSLLSSDEQLLLRRLANFAGSFTVDHAIACGEEAGCRRPPEVLFSLCEKSLIAVDTTNEAPIYRLLNTTRAYVASIHAD